MYCYATDIKIKVLKAFQQVGYKLQIKVITVEWQGSSIIILKIDSPFIKISIMY